MMEKLRNRRILVIEDVDDLKVLATAFLAGSGYSVDCVSNGEEALAYLRSKKHQPPALIVLDLAMPVMDGHQFLEVRDQESTLSAIPLIIFSNDVPVKTRLRPDVTDIVYKTAGRKRFLEAVEKALEQSIGRRS